MITESDKQECELIVEQEMIDATILTLYSACEGQFSDYCEDSDFGNEHMEWLHEQMKRIKSKS